jgi:hypothetical protein
MKLSDITGIKVVVVAVVVGVIEADLHDVDVVVRAEEDLIKDGSIMVVAVGRSFKHDPSLSCSWSEKLVEKCLDAGIP